MIMTHLISRVIMKKYQIKITNDLPITATSIQLNSQSNRSFLVN